MNRPKALKRVKTLPPLPPRPDDGHKGTFGRALVVAGSRGMSGAAVLAGLGALRAGAGLVTVASPRGILTSISSGEPSYLTVPLPEDDTGRIVNDARSVLSPLVEQQTAVAIGPGLGQSTSLGSLVRWFFSHVDRPVVLDADALNLLAAGSGGALARDRRAVDLPTRIFTPHPGEFARLLKTDTAAVQKDRERLAVDFAAKHGIVLVLKGHRSIITDGERIAINTTGNSGMATGGCGDVLTGLVVGLLAQGMGAFEAAQLGVYLHGLAGDLAVKEISRPALIASDLPAWIGRAWIAIEKEDRRRARR